MASCSHGIPIGGVGPACGNCMREQSAKEGAVNAVVEAAKLWLHTYPHGVADDFKYKRAHEVAKESLLEAVRKLNRIESGIELDVPTRET